MDIPSLFMIPSAVSSGKVHSVFPNSTDADFDFNRDSDATRVNSEGLIERVGYYGAELVVNGNYDDNSAWTISGGNAEISNGKLNFDNAANYGTSVSNSASVVSGKTYFVKFTISNYSSGAAQIRLGSQFGTSRNANGTYTEYIVANATLIRLYSSSNNTTLSIDNVSVKEVTGDRARLNYEIEGGLVNTKPSLLLEPQSTNIITQSEDFSGYFNGNIRIESNQIVAPDGVSKSSKLSKTTFFQNIQLVATVSNSTNYSLSVFAKKGTLNRITLRLASGSNDVRKSLDLSDLSVSNAGGNQTGFVSSKVEELANDWYRFSITATSGGTSQFINIYAGKGDVDETGNIYIWGAQFEEQSYPTSYIPTNGSSQTRAAETCNGAGTSSILPSEEGILYGEFAALVNDATFRLFSLSDGTSANRVFLGFGSISNTIHCNITNSNVAQAPLNHTVSDIKLFHKAAIRFKANNVKLYVNGTQVALDTSATIPSTFSSVQFNSGSGSSVFYGKIRDIRVYNTKEMTDSEVDILLTKITS